MPQIFTIRIAYGTPCVSSDLPGYIDDGYTDSDCTNDEENMNDNYYDYVDDVADDNDTVFTMNSSVWWNILQISFVF